VSPTQVCSLLSFVRTVYTLVCTSWLVWPAQLVTRIVDCYCHQVCLLSCPGPSHSVSFIEQVCQTVRLWLSNANRGRGKGHQQRLRTKSCHSATLLILTPQCSTFT